MALASKSSEDLFDRTGSGKKRMDDTKQSRISASFASGVINEAPELPDAAEALIYQIKLIQEDIDEIRRYVTNEATSSAIDLTAFTGGRNLPTTAGSAGTLYRDRSGFIKVS